MTKRRVVVTGLGVISPLGSDIDTFWKNIQDGKSGITTVKNFDTSGYQCKYAGHAVGFDASKHFSPKELRRTALFTQFAVVAAKMALQDANYEINEENAEKVGVIVGSGIGGLGVVEDQQTSFLEKGPRSISPFLIPMLIVNMAPGVISIEVGAKGPNSCTVTACASGTHAIGEGFRLIQSGLADTMICGGTEAAITNLSFGGFDAMKALSRRSVNSPEDASCPFDKRRDGFVMGEGCGIVFLEEYEAAKKRNANIYAEMIGYGMSGDAYHVTAPSPEGEGAARCMDLTLEDGNLKKEDLEYINAHGTSTPMNDKFETMAIKSLLKEHAYKVAISSTKSMTGHLLGAAGGLEGVVSVLALKHGVIPPTINYNEKDPDCDLDYVPNEARSQKIKSALSNSLGFGGHNASILFAAI